MFTNNECTSVSAPYALAIQSAVILSLLCLVTVPANALVIIVILKDPLKKFRSPFYNFILILGLADFVTGLVFEPAMINVLRKEALEVATPSDEYEAYHSVFFACSWAAISSIFALTVDRYMAVSSPFKYRSEKTRKRSYIVISLILLFSCLSPLIYLKLKYVVSFFIYTNFGVITTFIFIVLTYVKVNHTIRMQARALAENSPDNENRRDEVLLRKQDQKITRGLLSMLFAFLMCNGPACIIVYTMNLCGTCDCATIHWLRDYSLELTLLNSAVNPFVYTMRIPNFKESVKHVLGLRGAIADEE